MSTLSVEPLIHHCRGETSKLAHGSRRSRACSLHRRPRWLGFRGRSFFCDFKPPLRPLSRGVRACSSSARSPVAVGPSDVVFDRTFDLKQTSMIEGKIFIKLDHGKGGKNWKFSVGCDLPGVWTLHWGVTYIEDVGNEWDQPPKEMIPRESIYIKDYAIETPLKKPSSSSKKDKFQSVEIDFDPKSRIAAINFVLKDESTGAWYQHKGRDFKVPLVKYLCGDGYIVGQKKGFSNWAGTLAPLSNILFKSETSYSKDENSSTVSGGGGEENMPIGFYEELPIAKGVDTINHTTVSVRKCSDTGQSLVSMETDLLGDVVIHWGVCRDEAKKWEIPKSPVPPNTVLFRGKALRTHLKVKEDGSGSFGSFTLEDGYEGFLFVLKQNENSWLNCRGNDFYIPLPISNAFPSLPKQDQSEVAETPEQSAGENESSPPELSDSILGEMRNLVSGISSEKSRMTKTKGAQESLLKEIEKLAAEAYSMFRSSIPILPEEKVTKVEELEPPPVISSGTGTGFEILCQGFNWESHKSGKWYIELKEKAEELASLGVSVIWLPPPTESVSPEGYMPKDLYNLNSRYGNMTELQEVVKKFHAVGVKVLGDVVLNHRCAHYQNQNGVWNIFGGRLNWDDRAIVADDPHFQGRGNKSSGDSFHAAPNIDHSQDFVRKDIKEWLCYLRGNKSSGDSFHAAPNIDHSQDFVRKDIKEWLCYLRKEIGYDGWRLDFVRGFWGGYVKDYLEASEPCFAVGEYWDSLSYTYGEMDHNQDAHRQRIVDWINAADGTAGAFDVTTKGILHAALERCEYWRLSDKSGKPPGVLGWWPSRAVTFIENHDTGSTQGHWRFPGGKEMQGYAYILTHPGTPSVFYDHIFSHCRAELTALIALRKRSKINCRSRVQITKAERDVYVAIIDERVAVKIGPGHYEPTGPQKWSQALEGRDYKVWEASK